MDPRSIQVLLLTRAGAINDCTVSAGHQSVTLRPASSTQGPAGPVSQLEQAHAHSHDKCDRGMVTLQAIV